MLEIQFNFIISKRLEDIGRSRQQLILHHFKELSRISEEIPNGLTSASSALTKAINQVDVNKDIQGDYYRSLVLEYCLLINILFRLH